MSTHHNHYTEDDIEHVARQLQAITVNDRPVFQVIISKAALVECHVIYLDTGRGTETLEFRKKKEAKE